MNKDEKLLNWIEAEEARQNGAKLQVRDVMHGCTWRDADGEVITEHCSDLEWRVVHTP